MWSIVLARISNSKSPMSASRQYFIKPPTYIPTRTLCDHVRCLAKFKCCPISMKVICSVCVWSLVRPKDSVDSAGNSNSDRMQSNLPHPCCHSICRSSLYVSAPMGGITQPVLRATYLDLWNASSIISLIIDINHQPDELVYWPWLDMVQGSNGLKSIKRVAADGWIPQSINLVVYQHSFLR